MLFRSHLVTRTQKESLTTTLSMVRRTSVYDLGACDITNSAMDNVDRLLAQRSPGTHLRNQAQPLPSASTNSVSPAAKAEYGDVHDPADAKDGKVHARSFIGKPLQLRYVLVMLLSDRS